MSTSNNCCYCAINEKAHSFFCYEELDIEKSNTKYKYKTIVAEAELYDKPETIIHHIETTLIADKEKDKENSWEWAVDFTGAGLKHYMALNTVSELSRWIQREKNNKCENLEQIVILGAENNVLIYPLIYLAKVFLPSHIEITVD